MLMTRRQASSSREELPMQMLSLPWWLLNYGNLYASRTRRRSGQGAGWRGEVMLWCLFKTCCQTIYVKYFLRCLSRSGILALGLCKAMAIGKISCAGERKCWMKENCFFLFRLQLPLQCAHMRVCACVRVCVCSKPFEK